jgi:uncharacterized protein YegP (UPF0339 family)
MRVATAVRKCPGRNSMSQFIEGNVHYWMSPKNQQWYFKVVAGNGETVAQSEGYKELASAKKGAASVKKALNLPEDPPEE